MFDKAKMKKSMIYHKDFLGRLYISNAMERKKLLIAASDSQIKLVLQIVYLVTTGIIPVSKICFEKLSSEKKTKYLHQAFGTQTKITKLLKSARKIQIDHLFKLITCFDSLFHR